VDGLLGPVTRTSQKRLDQEYIEKDGKKGNCTDKTTGDGRQGQPVPPDRSGAWTARCQHHPKRDKVARVTRAQVEEIAKLKMPDLNAYDLDAACKIIEGTARSMGIEVA